ncbi:LPS O-antigen chain length determinant protein WzzB [Marinomonas transparens]|uniref:LPS O-antigen length regulator n=1 Tax=Marinomonas transparens TaxID=2795388 RepID=A0A934JVK0_9GAMM|nr:Wzz/FepE/Etk N-terminal domain-containing protein [Marinomonas transparens]MBJ7537822.1 hypothetical protein [Marinomonas transparens]
MGENQLSQVSSLPKHDDEIDLKELIVALWQGKFIIIVTTVICAAIAVVYALNAKEVWTAEALITQPQISDFSDYQKMVSEFQPVFDVYQVGGDIRVSSSLDRFVLPQTLFSIYVQEFESRKNRKAYISMLPEFQDELEGLRASGSEDIELALYARWDDRLSANLVKGSNSYVLTGMQSSSKGSYDLLNGYIQFVEGKARERVIANLDSIVDGKRSSLIQQKALLTDLATAHLDYELRRSKYALQIAKAAGINKPQQNLGDEELFAINIGANALEAKVDVLEGLKELSVIEPRLQQIDSKLALLKTSQVDSNISFDTFQFVEEPEKPISRTSPKRALIAMLGVLLGGMLGCAIVLIRYAFKSKE